MARYLNKEYPTEDDVLHCDALPTFSNTLSREESEQLMSYLTVDYVRIPLVLGFFASRDRVTYLFNPALQALLRAVLLEGQWGLGGVSGWLSAHLQSAPSELPPCHPPQAAPGSKRRAGGPSRRCRSA